MRGIIVRAGTAAAWFWKADLNWSDATALSVLALAAVAAALALGWWLTQREAPAPTQLRRAGRRRPKELRFAPGSPQLNFIKVEPVEALPEPLLDPLNARIAYDENYTARVSSPIAGRVTRILAQPGDRVAAGPAAAGARRAGFCRGGRRRRQIDGRSAAQAAGVRARERTAARRGDRRARISSRPRATCARREAENNRAQTAAAQSRPRAATQRRRALRAARADRRRRRRAQGQSRHRKCGRTCRIRCSSSPIRRICG